MLLIFKAVLWALKIALVVYIGLCLLLFLRQSALVYFPSAEILQTPAEIGLAYEDVQLLTSDGLCLAAWYVPFPDAQKTVLICHGNGGNIGDRLPVINLFHEMRLNVLIFDYRGYGGSAGRPSETGTYRDAMAAWQYLELKRGIAPGNIVVFGRSLGGAVAAQLAQQKAPGALILEATFTSIPELADRFYPWLPIRWLCRFSYNTLERMPKINCPVMIAHSRDDEMISFEHGLRIFEAARHPKTFFELTGSHNDGEAFFSKAYGRKLKEFLSED